MRRALAPVLVAVATIAAGLIPAAASGATAPPQDRDWCRQVAPSLTWSVKNVEVLCRIDAFRHGWDANGNLIADPNTPSGLRETLTQVIALNWIEYGNPRPDQPATAATRDVMFVSGRFGMKSYDMTNPLQPKLLDWIGDGIDDPNMGADGNLAANRFGLIDDVWQNEDMDVDHNRKLVFLSRDPRAYGGSTGDPTDRSGIYVFDVRNPEKMDIISFVELPGGHTTTCVNDCKWLWTGGPAPNTDQQAMGWAGRPIFVTDMRDPYNPKPHPAPIDLGRNDGTTDYAHDVDVDETGVAWVSGRGAVRGYWTKGLHFDPLQGKARVATAIDPIPYGGGGFEETVAPTRTTNSRFMHNAERHGDLIFATEEEFQGGCQADGPLMIASLEGSFNGEAWKSTTADKFRLKTVGTWHPFGKEGSSTSSDCSAHYFKVIGNILSMSFYSQGSRFLDISDPANPTEVAYFRPGTSTWATYHHKGLYYSADRNGVYILRLTDGATAGAMQAATTSASAASAAAYEPAPADPAEEALALLERPAGYQCGIPLPD